MVTTRWQEIKVPAKKFWKYDTFIIYSKHEKYSVSIEIFLSFFYNETPPTFPNTCRMIMNDIYVDLIIIIKMFLSASCDTFVKATTKKKSHWELFGKVHFFDGKIWNTFTCFFFTWEFLYEHSRSMSAFYYNFSENNL